MFGDMRCRHAPQASAAGNLCAAEQGVGIDRFFNTAVFCFDFWLIHFWGWVMRKFTYYHQLKLVIILIRARESRH
jgi:hypothetical protein